MFCRSPICVHPCPSVVKAAVSYLFKNKNPGIAAGVCCNETLRKILLVSLVLGLLERVFEVDDRFAGFQRRLEFFLLGFELFH